MLKYVDTLITFSEVPDEISLCINISNCPCECPGCHSSYLAKDIGIILNSSELNRLIYENKGITCVCLMGGDSDPSYVNILAEDIHNHGLKTAWYSGRSYISEEIQLHNFDYIKIGPYIENLGGLTNKTTNQIMYMVDKQSESPLLIDITYKFHK